jgi:hypothetical protein
METIRYHFRALGSHGNQIFCRSTDCYKVGKFKKGYGIGNGYMPLEREVAHSSNFPATSLGSKLRTSVKKESAVRGMWLPGDKGCTGSHLNPCNLILLSMILQLE